MTVTRKLTQVVVLAGAWATATIVAPRLFSLFALPDTQEYTNVWYVRNYNGGRLSMFTAQTQWIQDLQHKIATSGGTPFTLPLYGHNGDSIKIAKVAFVATHERARQATF